MSHYFRNTGIALLAGVLLAGCSTPSLVAKPEPYNFEEIAKDPSKEAKQNLKVEVFGNGIKDTKKFVIGAFQVRVRTDLTGEYSSAGLQQPNELAGGNEAIFQKATDALYVEFVANLKKRGIEVVNHSVLKKYPEYQEMGSNSEAGGKWTLKGTFPSGHPVALGAADISNEYQEDSGGEIGAPAVNSWFGKTPHDNYKIFYPAAVPGLNYVQNSVTLFGSNENPIGDLIASSLVLSDPIMAAAAHDKLGVITVVFELEMVKFGRERTDRVGYTAGFAIGGGVPMVRTKLAALKMLPPGAQRGTFFNAGGFTEGLRMRSKHRGFRHAGLKSMFDGDVFAWHWVEIDDGSAVFSSPGVISPVPAKFPAAFKKATDGNLQLMMYAIEHPSDF